MRDARGRLHGIRSLSGPPQSLHMTQLPLCVYNLLQSGAHVVPAARTEMHTVVSCLSLKAAAAFSLLHKVRGSVTEV